jgi:hypothetical protein
VERPQTPTITAEIKPMKEEISMDVGFKSEPYAEILQFIL